MLSLRARFLASCMTLGAVVWASPQAANAEDKHSELDKDAARASMQQGDERLNGGDLKGALEAYQRADDIMGVPTTSLDVGKVAERLGKLVVALEAYERAASHKPKPGEPRPFAAARKQARWRVAKLKPRVPTAVVSLKHDGKADVTVTVDGVQVDLYNQDFYVRPGLRVFRAEAPNYRRTKSELAFEEGMHREVVLHLKRVDDTKVVVVEKLVPGDTVDSGPWLPMAIAGFAVGGVGLAAGGIFGAVTLSDASTLSGACTDERECPDSVKGEVDRSAWTPHVSTGGFVLGGLGLALGVTSLAFHLSEDGGGSDEATDDGAAVELDLRVGPGFVGLNGRF